jgi:hypothetical protein
MVIHAIKQGPQVPATNGVLASVVELMSVLGFSVGGDSDGVAFGEVDS